MGKRETRLLDQARNVVQAGNDANANGEPPWYYYAKASELAKGLPAARLADALEEALDGWLDDARTTGAEAQIASLRAVLAEVDRGR